MRPSRSLPATLLALTLALTIGCGGDDNGTETPPPPPPVAAVELTIPDTDLTVGETTQAAVTLRDASGNVVSGRTVAWASSDDDVAAVDAGGLVTATGRGSATITATSEGVSDTGEVAALLPVFEPGSDTELGGDNAFETFTVPENVTVTLSDNAVLRVVGDAVVAGDMTGDCHGVDLVAGGEVTVTGNITNTCSDGSSAAGIRLVSGGDITLRGTQVRSSGDVEITNDTTLTDDDFDPGGAPARSTALGGTAALQLGFCIADGAEFIPDPPARPAGDDGHTWILTCNGDAQLTGGTEVRGQSGGGGDDIEVEGGDGDTDVNGDGAGGGDAGRLEVRSTGTLDFPPNAAVVFQLGDGGDGGSVVATATAPGASATATGGPGGESGTLKARANGGIIISQGGLIIRPGTPGSGGMATATAADGRDAGDEPAQAGGSATATGGTGGNSPEARLRSRGSVVGLDNIQIDNAPGGVGGDAVATGGKGGDGNPQHTNGAAGGAMSATGGPGGESMATGLAAAPIGVGGMGGSATINRGLGGIGFDGCSVDPDEAGGNGGQGGAGSATSGLGGSGNLRDGDPGDVTAAGGTGDGGAGGDGNGPGGGGAGGAAALNANGGMVDDQNPNFADGADGNPCPGAPQPIEFLLDLSDFIGLPGTVAPGAYSVPMAGGNLSGTLPLETEGQVFWSDAGTVGPRFGFGTDGSIVFDLVGAGLEGGEVAGSAFFGACDSERRANTTLSFEITALGAGGAPLASPGSGPIRVDTDAEGCFGTELPSNTERVRVRFTGSGFVDLVAITLVLLIIVTATS